MITIESIERENDEDGRMITRYIPSLSGIKGFPCFTGKLTFAVWEVWTDASISEHETAILNATNNARDVLRQIADKV